MLPVFWLLSYWGFFGKSLNMNGMWPFSLIYSDHTDCRDAVRWVCEFIETQGLQKPHMHSKDLHTSIVAAFRTLLVWIMEHPHLLVNEVIKFTLSLSFLYSSFPSFLFLHLFSLSFLCVFLSFPLLPYLFLISFFKC